MQHLTVFRANDVLNSAWHYQLRQWLLRASPIKNETLEWRYGAEATYQGKDWKHLSLTRMEVARKGPNNPLDFLSLGVPSLSGLYFHLIGIITQLTKLAIGETVIDVGQIRCCNRVQWDQRWHSDKIVANRSRALEAEAVGSDG